MPRTFLASHALIVLSLSAAPALAQSVGLTVQSGGGVTAATAVRSADAAEARKLSKEADKFMAQKRHDIALALYEKAYRLAPSDQANYARLLNAKRAAGRLTAEDREALDLIERQQATRVQQTLAEVRLELVQARAALRDGDAALAKAKAQSAGMNLDNLPPDVDVGIYRQQIKQALNSARRADRRLAKARQVDESLTLGDAGEMTPVNTTPPADATTPPADPAPVTTADTGNDNAIAIHDSDQHVYDRSVAAALRQNHVDWVLRTHEDTLVPTTDLTYPADFATKTRNRARYRDGVVYESQPFTGADGQTYTTAIYDISDLVVSVPDFYAPYPATAREQRQWELDRQFIRDRSYIFNGYPEDLAAGLPLLHFFGGINQGAIGGATDPYQRARVLRTIDAFLNQQNAGGGGLAPVQAPQGLQPGMMQAD